MQQYYAYIYRDPSTNVPFLVGKGTKRRAWDHLKRKDHHPATYKIQKILREGMQPSIEVIEAIDEAHSFFLEKCLISVLGRRDLGLGPLCNLTDGGDGIVNISPESAARRYEKTRGQKRTAETCRNISASVKGKKRSPLSEEQKAKTAAALRGQKREAITGEKISKKLSKPCTIDGINIYPKFSDLAKALGSGKNGTRSPNFRYVI